MSRIINFKNFLNESNSTEDIVDKIIDTMLDIIDDGVNVTFKSPTGDMKYTDYLSKNIGYQNFKPIIISKNKTASKFSIVLHQTSLNQYKIN